MAISDDLFILAIGWIIAYLVVYRANKIVGSIAFIALATIGYAYSTATTIKAVSMVLLLCSFASLLYSWLTK